MTDKQLRQCIKELRTKLQKQNKMQRTASIGAVSPYSENINKHIRSLEELKIFKQLGLKEGYVTRPSLLLDIDISYSSPSGITNIDYMLSGHAPIDSKSGQFIQLHHIGQQYDSPFAELPALIHLGTETYSKLHDTKLESWRIDKHLTQSTTAEICEYWKKRGKALENQIR